MANNSRFTDSDYLKDVQYRDSRNLGARISLHEQFSTNPLGLHTWVFDQLDLPPTAAILEAGCGPADLWHNNRQRIPRGWQVILSDLSPGMVREALHRLRHAGNFFYASFDIMHAPFPVATFDAVIANHMLYHVPDIQRALATIHGLLKPGGVLYATTNGRTHLQELSAFITRARGHPSPEVDNIFQRNIATFTLQSGGRHLAAHFPRVERRAYPDSLVVDDIEPVIHYVESSTLFNFSAADLTRLRALLRDEITAHGAIAISKESGLFIAQK